MRTEEAMPKTVLMIACQEETKRKDGRREGRKVGRKEGRKEGREK
jgi:hypothetical protein